MKKEQLISGLIQGSGLPKQAFDGYAQIELTGNEEAVIDGCKGIIEYSDEKITLNLGKICAEFSGSGLEMKTFEYEQAIIKGTFINIGFS
ncbi:MAG: YabP/YqfC family sporulation protein [Clostridia bacterium]|nr:YabP/YqfC family sporulation protein [Clostridia bacterium]